MGTLSGQPPALLPAAQGNCPTTPRVDALATPPSAPSEALETDLGQSEEAPPLHPFNNPSLPPIPKRLLKAIKAGRYVDQGDLLPEALSEAFDKSAEGGKEDKASKKKFPITTPLEWGLDFATFASATTHYHPSKAQQLLAYSGIIFRLAREVGGSTWMRYDRAFRQATAFNPSLPWDRREPDTWLASLAEDGHPKRPPADCPQVPPKKKPYSFTTNTCLRWNRGQCRSSACRFAHKCLVCQATSHPATTCPVLQPPPAACRATPAPGVDGA